MATALLERLARDGANACLSTQVCRAFLVVLTRGPVEGRTFGVEEALAALGAWTSACELLDDGEPVLPELLDLIRRFAVRGKQAHDANIVATMRRTASQFSPRSTGAIFAASAQKQWPPGKPLPMLATAAAEERFWLSYDFDEALDAGGEEVACEPQATRRARTHVYRVRLDDLEMSTLQALAKRRGVNVSVVLRELVRAARPAKTGETATK